MIQALKSHLAKARWFGGKNREWTIGEIAEIATLPSPVDETFGKTSFKFLGVSIDYPDYDPETYLIILEYSATRSSKTSIGQTVRNRLSSSKAIPSRPHSGGFLGVDKGQNVYLATQSETALPALTQILLNPKNSSASLQITLDDLPKIDSSKVQVLDGEQSNTSLIVDDRVIIKLFRQLIPGINRDIELSLALNRIQTTGVAKCYGRINAKQPLGQIASHVDPSHVDLGMVSEFVTPSQDGFELAVANAINNQSFHEECYLLGQTLAEVHLGLAEQFPKSKISGAEVSIQMKENLAKSVLEVSQLEPLTSKLNPLFEALDGLTIPTQQVHGDFHLGQCLWGSDGWRIIDFEGEPLRPLVERNRPDSVFRDLAGLARSLSYAGSVASQSLGSPNQSDRSEWVSENVQAFITGYLCNSESVAPRIGVEKQILSAYIADKAIYETVYEARNRPNWVTIPIQGLHELTDQDTVA